MGGRWGRLTEARKQCGYTQSALASSVEMSSITLSRWENEPELPESAIQLVRLARMLDVSQNSVWKCESGQAEPSIRVLVWYSDRFSVSLDQLLYEDLASRISKKK